MKKRQISHRKFNGGTYESLSFRRTHTHIRIFIIIIP